MIVLKPVPLLKNPGPSGPGRNGWQKLKNVPRTVTASPSKRAKTYVKGFALSENDSLLRGESGFLSACGE